MSLLQLEAQERHILGKQSKQLRKEGKLPAVIYGNNFTTLSLTVDMKSAIKAIEKAGRTSIINLVMHLSETKQEEPVLLWNVKRNPVDNSIEHIDFYKVNKEEKVKIRIPLVFIGISKGVKLGGKLEIYREYMDIIAYPQDLISEIAVDITDVGPNETIHIQDIEVPPTITKVYDSNIAILSVILNTASEEQ